MSHAVILAHPNPRSFDAAMASAYAEDLKAWDRRSSCETSYALRFDPCLKASEIPGPSAFTPEPDVLAERALLAKAEVFVFVYPFWFNARRRS